MRRDGSVEGGYFAFAGTAARRLVAHVQNLSRLLDAEASLEESERRLHQILDQTSALVFWKDLDGRYLFINAEFTRVIDKPADAILGRRDVDVLPPRSPPASGPTTSR